MATEFWAKEFDGGGQPSAAAIVAGMKGKEPVNFDTAARDLVREGHDVVVYEYDDLFAHGDPNELPALIEAISIDFELRTADHARKRYAGYSLGAGIAYNLQKRTAAETDTGLIVSGGTQAAENLFENPVFKMLGLPQRFRKNGYDRPDVEALWSDMQRPPITPFVVAFGAVRLKTPSCELFSTTNLNALHKSFICINEKYCFPLPIFPPSPNLKGVTIFANAPPLLPRTIPNLKIAHLTPNSFALEASSSQSLQTFAKKSVPNSYSSSVCFLLLE